MRQTLGRCPGATWLDSLATPRCAPVCGSPGSPVGGRFRSTSMASASRLKSSMTLNVRKRRPSHNASDMKSIDQLPLMCSPATNRSGCRLGTRFLPRRRRLSCIKQYTRHTLLWFHTRPRRRINWNSLSKPRSGKRSANSANSAMTSSSRSGRRR